MSCLAQRTVRPAVGGLLWLLMSVGLAAPGAAQPADPAARSAAYLLGQCVQASANGKHDRLLRALRHLRDPALEPLFSRLAQSPQPSLKAHGIMGLAELHPQRQIDLKRLAEVDDPTLQATLISAAMDEDLLGDEAADQLLNWPGLDMGAKLLVAIRQLGEGKFSDAALLREALQSDREARRGLAAVMLLELGDPAGPAELQKLDQSQAPQRDVVRAMLLETAMRHQLRRAATWAYAIAGEPGTDERLRLLALRVALRLGESGAGRLWREQFDAAREPADRIRLALVALQLSPWLDPALFEPLAASDDPLMKSIGQAGRAVAAGDSSAAQWVVELVQRMHPLVNAWALRYARQQAKPLEAQLILLSLIDLASRAPQQGLAQHLEHAMEASWALDEQDPAVAANLLGPILADPNTPRLLVQSILVGLLQVPPGQPQPVIDALPTTLPDLESRHLALLLRAKHGQSLSPQQVDELGLLVRGGGRLEDTLRIQAAWAWLKHTGQAQAALARLLESH